MSTPVRSDEYEFLMAGGQDILEIANGQILYSGNQNFGGYQVNFQCAIPDEVFRSLVLGVQEHESVFLHGGLESAVIALGRTDAINVGDRLIGEIIRAVEQTPEKSYWVSPIIVALQ